MYRFFLDDENPWTWEELEVAEEAWGHMGRWLSKDAGEEEQLAAGQQDFGKGVNQVYCDFQGIQHFNMIGVSTAPRLRCCTTHVNQEPDNNKDRGRDTDGDQAGIPRSTQNSPDVVGVDIKCRQDEWLQNIEAAERLLEMTDRYGMVMRLAKGTLTLQATHTGNYTWVGNVWCTEELQGAVLKCNTEPSLRPPKTDHLPVIMEISIDMEKCNPRMQKNF
ncbi:hypothetical protein BDN71DRAFT_1432455 [Pleurotus eryngii]|uniref:Uncharacterized protein n=1 Tax=Pleurotus eryngii TaxID=5323 RepID=A0A9P6DEN6_PLEER|nr:hypothetical protein BDN71DRAFT_1432455 [Pleurotus eryngii]